MATIITQISAASSNPRKIWEHRLAGPLPQPRSPPAWALASAITKGRKRTSSGSFTDHSFTLYSVRKMPRQPVRHRKDKGRDHHQVDLPSGMLFDCADAAARGWLPCSYAHGAGHIAGLRP